MHREFSALPLNPVVLRCGVYDGAMAQDPKALYRRLGPVLFARARRALKSDLEAEAMTVKLIEQLAQTPGTPTDSDLLKQGRAQLQQMLSEHSPGAVVDSMVPGLGHPPE